MKIGSQYLKFSTNQTMENAQLLYRKGYISYPRTESTIYPKNFDFLEILTQFKNHPTLGKNVQNLLNQFLTIPKKGINIGGHPPITPLKVAVLEDFPEEENLWKLYILICIYFFASLSPSAIINIIEYKIKIGNCEFELISKKILQQGFLNFLTLNRKKYKDNFPELFENKNYEFSKISYEKCCTSPPEYMNEIELIDEMKKYHIGTAASISVHITNLSKRKYVQRDNEGNLIPTDFGVALIEALESVDKDFILPESREKIENLMNYVSDGKINFMKALEYALNYYRNKFRIFNINKDKLINKFNEYFKRQKNS